MPRYVALLRAINVGKRVVKMERLRELFEDVGLRNVATLIASGNVLFDSPSKSPAALEKKIEAHLWKSLGYEVDTFVRTQAELVDVVTLRPFVGSKQHLETTPLHVGFMKAALDPDACARLVGLKTDVDEFRVHGREYYWSAVAGLGQSKVKGTMIERVLKMPSTVRNITTVKRLAEL